MERLLWVVENHDQIQLLLVVFQSEFWIGPKEVNFCSVEQVYLSELDFSLLHQIDLCVVHSVTIDLLSFRNNFMRLFYSAKIRSVAHKNLVLACLLNTYIFKNARNLRVSFERFSQFSRPELDSTHNLSIELLVISKKGSQDFAATA